MIPNCKKVFYNCVSECAKNQNPGFCLDFCNVFYADCEKNVPIMYEYYSGKKSNKKYYIFLVIILLAILSIFLVK